ncbi:hypothetical protein FACS189459_3180 [Bacilli bacterium]|nr:hypothetical protein FACS189459_3180 [Bacilli bacterium]
MHETVNEIIKEKLANGIINSIVNIPEITLNDNVNIEVTKTKNYKFGDYTTNVLSLFSIPQECMENIANKIISNIKSDIFEKIVFVKPCFINFYLSHEFYSDFLNKVLSEKDNFGKFSNKNLFYNIEFVSANPTGLMHVGHARTAAYGDSLTKIFNFFGIKTNKEYYINDAGNQIDNLGYAVYVRYLQLYGNEIKLPDDSYHGEEIITCAEEIKNTIGDKYIKSDYKDKEVANYFKDASINYMLDNIKKDLSDYGVNFDI